jgi:hypothetical protein
MGPDQNPANCSGNQGRRKARRPQRRPRARLCLLKGCGRRFRPTRALARYCSADCAAEGRCWSLWKAQQRYRETKHGRRKRQVQSRRYRQRNPSHQNKRKCCSAEARVITPEFFRVFLRPPWLLRPVLPDAPFSAAAFLQPRVPARRRTRPGAGTPLAGAHDCKPTPGKAPRFTFVRAGAEIVPTY